MYTRLVYRGGSDQRSTSGQCHREAFYRDFAAKPPTTASLPYWHVPNISYLNLRIILYEAVRCNLINRRRVASPIFDIWASRSLELRDSVPGNCAGAQGSRLRGACQVFMDAAGRSLETLYAADQGHLDRI